MYAAIPSYYAHGICTGVHIALGLLSQLSAPLKRRYLVI